MDVASSMKTGFLWVVIREEWIMASEVNFVRWQARLLGSRDQSGVQHCLTCGRYGASILVHCRPNAVHFRPMPPTVYCPVAFSCAHSGL